MKKYEALLIFPDTLKDDALEASVNRARGEVERLGGTLGETQVLGKKQFARTMQKRDSGFYVRMAFSLDADKVAPLNARFKLHENLFRLQIVNVDRMPVVPRVAAPAEAAAAAPAGARE